MSIIKQLRALMPGRPLNHTEARSVAEKQATKLLELSGITEPHVSASAIEDLPKIEIEHRGEGLPLSGHTVWKGGRWMIGINPNDAAVRQRFTIGHEFKHVLDHPFITAAYPGTIGRSSHRRGEDICDYFSACLLMPRAWVKDAWVNLSQDVDYLALHFGVSRIAMRIRLIDIGLLEQRARHRYFRTAPPTGEFNEFLGSIVMPTGLPSEDDADIIGAHQPGDMDMIDTTVLSHVHIRPRAIRTSLMDELGAVA